MSNTQKKKEELEVEISIEKGGMQNTLGGIIRCVERLEKLIEYEAPMFIVNREVNIIQYRALDVLSMYEALALLRFAYKDEKPKLLGKTFPCCHCGRKTAGSRNEDGELWAICPECMEEQDGRPSALGKGK